MSALCAGGRAAMREVSASSSAELLIYLGSSVPCYEMGVQELFVPH